MIEAIISVLVAYATSGTCLGPDIYPDPSIEEPITGYVVLQHDGLGGCAIPTTPELTAKALCDLAETLADPTGEGRGIGCERG